VISRRIRHRVDDRLRIEIGAERREFAIEQIVHDAIELQLLGELIRAVQVRDPVIRQLDVLVGVVADIPLAADPDDVGTQLQQGRDPVIDAALDLVERNTWNLLAGRNQDVSVGIRRGIVRRTPAGR